MADVFAAWAALSDSQKIYLVETSFRRLADGAVLPLYCANFSFTAGEHFYIPCVSGLPRLTRKSNDTLSPNHIPTWGELELHIEPDYRPDAGRSATWAELLSEAYNFLGQPLVIKIGGEGFAYGDFKTIFTGRIGGLAWTETRATLTVYDKARDLEKKVPDFELPERADVVEDNWDQVVPLVLGKVKNCKPVLVNTGLPGPYPTRYAVACHVIQKIEAVYLNGEPHAETINWQFVQRDLSPPRKNGDGSARLDVNGPYTGALYRAGWLIQIDSVAAGREVGQATFRWKLDGDAAWRGEGILTWKLGYDSTTLVKSPSVSHGVMAVSGIYTGDCKLAYTVKVTRSGDIGDPVPPQFIWSDDGGVTWNPDDVCTWTPIAAAPGVMSVAAHNPGDSVRVEITTGGNVGGAVRFKWSQDGGATWDTNNQIPNTSPIELFPGYSIQFTAPGVPGVNDYDAGDAGSSTSAIDIDADPIVLNRGLSVTFSGAGHTEPTWTWTPIGAAPGVCSVTEGDPQDVFIIITLSGPCMGATFDWVIGINSGSGVTHTFPQEIYPGYRVAFADPGGADDYEVGDQSVLGSYYAPAFIVNDTWAFTFKEIPIPLADGVTIQFFTQAEDDFSLWDQWNFILMSCLRFISTEEAQNITLDALGLISPITGAYVDSAGEIIRALAVLFAGWDGEADFDTAALAAFLAAIPYEIGLWVNSPTEVSQIIDDLLDGIPVMYTITLAGKFFIKEISAPAGAPDLELADVEIIASPESKNVAENICRRIYLRYDRNWNSVKINYQERREWVRREWRQVSARDEDVLLVYPLAGDMGPIDTALVQRSQAQVLAQKLLDLYKVRHSTLTVKTSIQPFLCDMGNKIAVNWELWPPTLHVITGMEFDFSESRATLTLWR